MVHGIVYSALKDAVVKLLRVDVVRVIADTYKLLGQEVPPVDRLLEEAEKTPEVWETYAKGFTMGQNQTEQEKTTERVMRFKPKNIVELSAFVAAIRPGAKSLVDDFVNRRKHIYGIKSMDDLLRLNGATGVTGESSFLFFDEQILTLAEKAGIAPEDAYVLIKSIKKKKHAKVAAFKDQFIPGFKDYLKREEQADDALAEKTAAAVWQTIIDSASYLFCAAHAHAMAYDSLYGAMLKVKAPYEFYLTLLKLYTEKGNKQKIAKIINEMVRYKGIKLRAGKFGEDNRDWTVNKETQTISQSLSSIKQISQIAANALYELKDIKCFKPETDDIELAAYNEKHQKKPLAMPDTDYTSFVDVCRYIQKCTPVKKNQMQTLIAVGYFDKYGSESALTKLYDAFIGSISKSLGIGSVIPRMIELRKLEQELCGQQTEDEIAHGIVEKAKAENEYVGLCLSSSNKLPQDMYIAQEVESEYGVKIKAFSVARGTTGLLRMKKTDFEQMPLFKNDTFYLKKWKPRNKYSYKNGQRAVIPDEFENWIISFTKG